MLKNSLCFTFEPFWKIKENTPMKEKKKKKERSKERKINKKKD